MRVHEDKARALLLALGYENAMKYGTPIVASRLERVEADTTDAAKLAVKDPNLKRLMLTVMRAVKTGDRVELIDPMETRRNKTVETFGKKLEREANEKAEVSHGSGPDRPVKDRPKVLGRSDDDVPVQKRHEEPKSDKPPGRERAREILLKQAREEAARAAEADAQEASAARPRRTSKEEWPTLVLTEKTPPGPETIQRAIFNVIYDATESKPISKEEVVERLQKKFPDKPKKNLKWNVDGFPHWLPKCFPFSVHQKDKRYWLEEIRDEGQKE